MTLAERIRLASRQARRRMTVSPASIRSSAAALEEDYLRLSRRARAVFERVFYGQ